MSYTIRRLLLMLVVLLCSRTVYSQPEQQHILDSTPVLHFKSIYYPENLHSGEVAVSVGATITIAPRQVVRDEIRQIPQLTATVRVGLPVGFGIGARFAGNYIANQLMIKPSYSYSFNHLSFAIHTSPSLWIGTADFTGFNTVGMGFSNAVGFSMGLHFDDFMLTLSGEAITNYWHYTSFAEGKVNRRVTEFVGNAVTCSVEQDAFNGARINWGIRFNYTRPDYQLWLAFAETRSRVLTPEFFFGIIL